MSLSYDTCKCQCHIGGAEEVMRNSESAAGRMGILDAISLAQ